MFLEISKNSQGNTCARVSFLIKLQAIYLKGNSDTGIFLSFTQLLKTPFYRAPLLAASVRFKTNRKIKHRQPYLNIKFHVLYTIPNRSYINLIESPNVKKRNVNHIK